LTLTGRKIAIPESRELATLSQLLRKRGAEVYEVPLVAILDAPDPGPVLAWIRRFIDTPPAILILLTGEGLRRLLSLADTHELRSRLVATLGSVPVLTRGPKPERVLRDIGIKTSIQADVPTTAGVITTLQTMFQAGSLAGSRVGLQLYGEDPNQLLQDALQKLHAEVDTVAPYVYANEADEQKVCGFIAEMAAGTVDVVAFTSQPQLHRLMQVAARHQLMEQLNQGMGSAVIAAVGPVVKEQLELAGYKVSIMPERVYFMKPLVMAIQRYFEHCGSDDYNSPSEDEGDSRSGGTPT